MTCRLSRLSFVATGKFSMGMTLVTFPLMSTEEGAILLSVSMPSLASAPSSARNLGPDSKDS